MGSNAMVWETGQNASNYASTSRFKQVYGCETWSLTLREERRLRVFEYRVLRRVFGPKRDEVTGEWRNYIMRSPVICTPYPILCGW
jgi:hypothetical protein